MDPAQIVRQTAGATRFDTTADVGDAARGSASGSAMGYSVTIDADPVADLYDSMEEFSMLFEEGESKKVSDRRMGETRAGEARNRRHAYQLAVDRWTRSFPDLPSAALISSVLRRLRPDAGRLTARDLLRQAAEMNGDDASLMYATLDCLEEGCEEGRDDELIRLLREAKRTLERERGPELRAGVNLAEEVNARAANPAELRELRQMYRGEVLGFTTPQDCFRSLLATRGAGRLAAAIEFLLAATGADMQATTPSTSPEELRRIMLDLACVEVLKTVLESLNGLESRMKEQYGLRCLLTGEAMTGRVVDMTEQTFVGPPTVAAFLDSCGIAQLQARVDFMTQLTVVFRQLSPRMFKSESDRFRMLDSAQEVLDEAVDRAAEDEEKGKEAGE